MKVTIAGVGLLAIAAAMMACGGGSSTSSTPAASAASSSATKASGGAATAAAVGAAGTCKYLSDADAATLLPSAGQAQAATANTAAGAVTTCSWGTGAATNTRIMLIVSELKLDAGLAAAKTRIDTTATRKISGLGDAGGFLQLSSSFDEVMFVKGKVAAVFTVASPGVNADAVAAIALKIAANF